MLQAVSPQKFVVFASFHISYSLMTSFTQTWGSVMVAGAQCVVSCCTNALKLLLPVPFLLVLLIFAGGALTFRSRARTFAEDL